MTRLGTIAGARKALSGELPYLGDGCYRTAYLDGNVVYKVENEEGYEACANFCEIERYASKPVLPKGFRIVPMRYISVGPDSVIAARYIEGQRMGDCYCIDKEPGHDTNCLPDDISIALGEVGIDASWGNVIYDGSTHWIVDAQ